MVRAFAAVLIALMAVSGIPASAKAQDSLIGTWQGLYECPQGVTGLTLTIAGKAPGNLSGKFRFFPTPDNANPATGSYEIAVSFDPATSHFEVRGTRWIDQPQGYAFATLRGVLQGKQLIGTVENEGCGAFELTRTGS